MPIFATSVSSGWSSNASPAMNSDTVKPIPPSAATPGSCRRVIPSGSAPAPLRSAATVVPAMPASLPTTRPATIAQASVLVSASPRMPPRKLTPAFASANSGTTTNALTGCRACSRSRSSSRPPTFPVGVSRPSATPAIVAWTPDSNVASQAKSPTTTYGHTRVTPSARRAATAPKAAAAPRSHPSSIPCE